MIREKILFNRTLLSNPRTLTNLSNRHDAINKINIHSSGFFFSLHWHLSNLKKKQSGGNIKDHNNKTDKSRDEILKNISRSTWRRWWFEGEALNRKTREEIYDWPKNKMERILLRHYLLETCGGKDFLLIKSRDEIIEITRFHDPQWIIRSKLSIFQELLLFHNLSRAFHNFLDF